MFKRRIKSKKIIACVLLVSISFALYVFLIRVDERYFRLPMQDIPRLKWCKELRNITKPRNPVGLISTPGSGNTWLRYMLQQATGILTGSIDNDAYLQKHGFPGESCTDGSVLVVKSHWHINITTFDSIVLLIRNPRNSILAAANVMYALQLLVVERNLSDHVFYNIHDAVAPPSVFAELGNTWHIIFTYLLAEWTMLYTHWLTNYHGPKHVVFYENLVDDTEYELQSILDFLNVTVSQWDIACAMERRNDIDYFYRRFQKYKYFNPFTEDMYKKIELARNKVYDLVK